jgi:hypothetical protein
MPESWFNPPGGDGEREKERNYPASFFFVIVASL